MMTDLGADLTPAGALHWYAEAGVDEAIGDLPIDRYAMSDEQAARRQAEWPARPSGPAAGQNAGQMFGGNRQAAATPRPADGGGSVLSDSPQKARETATHVASQAKTVAALYEALRGFDGCPLKATASHTVFADGASDAPLMIIGDVPEDEDDRTGRPFAGVEGALLDRMLGSIGRDRASCYLTTLVPWRPPGKRSLLPSELAVCLPFLERHIEIVQPAALLLLGELPARSLFARDLSINRMRGGWHDYGSPGLSHPVPAIATFHPRYLLQQPKQRRLAWRDLLALKDRLASL